MMDQRSFILSVRGDAKLCRKVYFSRRGSEKLSTVKKGHKNGFFSRKLISQEAKHFISNISNTMPLLT